MSYQVLVVDDTSANRELVSSILSTSDGSYKVLQAVNGKDGFDKAVESLPDVILMDLRMPEVDGIEAIKMLKNNESTKNIPIIVLTAFSSSESLSESFEIGAFDYLTKPISAGELLSRLKKALGVTEEIKKIQSKANDLENLVLVTGNSQNSFILVKTDGELEWANEGFTHIHGLSLQEYKAKYGTTIFSLCQEPEIIAQFNQCIANKTSFDYSTLIKTRNGEKKWLQTFISPKFNAEGEVEKLIVTEIDITGLKNKEDELNKRNQYMQSVMENLGQANRKLEEQTKEINRQKQLIQEEQNKSEKLLMNILPFEIARQLKSKGTASTRQYKTVTVMFTDFKGFSTLTKELEPKDLVNILDTYFAKFDEIIGKHYLEKIKTIGDAYMCAGGLPLRNKSNPFDAVLAGLEIQNYMNHLNDSKVLNNMSIWELRIGIHTGSVVAGVVGRKKFAYDIWGETVNVASRMEQSGHVGMVNVSEVTYGYIKDFFECDYRGKIEAKNHGKIDMYFVNRLKEEYSEDKHGFIPNEKIINLVNRF